MMGWGRQIGVLLHGFTWELSPPPLARCVGSPRIAQIDFGRMYMLADTDPVRFLEPPVKVAPTAEVDPNGTPIASSFPDDGVSAIGWVETPVIDAPNLRAVINRFAAGQSQRNISEVLERDDGLKSQWHQLAEGGRAAWVNQVLCLVLELLEGTEQPAGQEVVAMVEMWRVWLGAEEGLRELFFGCLKWYVSHAGVFSSSVVDGEGLHRAKRVSCRAMFFALVAACRGEWMESELKPRLNYAFGLSCPSFFFLEFCDHLVKAVSGGRIDGLGDIRVRAREVVAKFEADDQIGLRSRYGELLRGAFMAIRARLLRP